MMNAPGVPGGTGVDVISTVGVPVDAGVSVSVGVAVDVSVGWDVGVKVSVDVGGVTGVGVSDGVLLASVVAVKVALGVGPGIMVAGAQPAKTRQMIRRKTILFIVNPVSLNDKLACAAEAYNPINLPQLLRMRL